MVDGDERQYEPRCVMRGKLLVEHDLLGGGHAAAPLLGPVRYRVAGAAQLLEPGLLKAHEGVVADAGLRLPPIGGYVSRAPIADLGAKAFELGGRKRHGYDSFRA